MVAGGVGARTAWGTGVLCGLGGAPADTSASASIAFSLRPCAVLAIWPAAAALTIFLNTVFTTPAEARLEDAAATDQGTLSVTGHARPGRAARKMNG